METMSRERPKSASLRSFCWTSFFSCSICDSRKRDTSPASSILESRDQATNESAIAFAMSADSFGDAARYATSISDVPATAFTSS
jgi:hypothetical protein